MTTLKISKKFSEDLKKNLCFIQLKLKKKFFFFYKFQNFSKFLQMTLCVRRFDRCVACGHSIAKEFAENGWKFVRDVMNSPIRLEQVTGLDELQASVDAVDIDFDDDDSVVDLWRNWRKFEFFEIFWNFLGFFRNYFLVY